MAIQDRERLRQLVGDYYHGLTTPESYREQRAQLLDNIGADIKDESETVTRKQPTEPRKTTSASTPVSKGSEASGTSFAPKKIAIAAVAVVGIAVIAYLAISQMTGSGPAPDMQMVEEQPAKSTSLERGDALVEEFLTRNDWAEDSLSNFLLAWGALDHRQRRLATEGRRYRQLTTTLHQRIREEAALIDAANIERLESLAGFAEKMGAPYRKSWTPVADQPGKSETVASADEPEELPVLESQYDEPAATPTGSTNISPEPIPVAAAPVKKTEQPVAQVVTKVDPKPAVVTARTAPDNDPCPAEIAGTRRPYCQDKLPDGSAGPPLVVLPTGSYAMGNDAIASEAPQHQVAIAHHLAMSRHEVTVAEYAQFCAATSLPCAEMPGNSDSPAVSVSWDDAVLYTEWLSDSTGFTYRLPSEAEWEFAARAGTQSPYYFGDEITPSSAHSSVNGRVDAPLPRSDRQINRNPFRLYHMSGNVREWTQDAWYPNYANAPDDGSARASENEAGRVVRGGSYSDPAAKLRSAAREALNRSHRDAVTGFRVAREVFASSH